MLPHSIISSFYINLHVSKIKIYSTYYHICEDLIVIKSACGEGITWWRRIACTRRWISRCRFSSAVDTLLSNSNFFTRSSLAAIWRTFAIFTVFYHHRTNAHIRSVSFPQKNLGFYPEFFSLFNSLQIIMIEFFVVFWIYLSISQQ
jgi:hypothetical protein